ncbi:geranylgeranyl reductase family protein [Chloroflexota bacterium]
MRDIIIIGAGPVGSYLAYRLAEMGYQVAVLERGEKIGWKACCTGIIGQECVSSFPIEDNIILREANSAKLFSPSGRLFRVWRRENQACIIDRAALDLAMANRAQDRGAQYILSSPVWNIEVRNNGVRVEVNRRGERLDFEARVVVIASGFGFGLLERLGIGRVSDFVAGVQIEVEAADVDEVEVYSGQEIAPGFFAWLVPISSHRARVGLLSRRTPRLHLKGLLSSLLAQGKIVSIEGEPSYGAIPLKPLARTYGERLIVVGDAAGQVKPTTGGGIYYSLLCADIAANTLKTALEGDDLSAKNLAGYERGWKKKLGRELRIGYWARKLYERLSDRQIDSLFDIMSSCGIDKVLLEAEYLSFDWHSEVVLRLLRDRAVSKAVEMMKIPLSLRKEVNGS